MNKSVVILIVGVFLVLAAIALYSVVIAGMNVKTVNIASGQNFEKSYELKKGNYTLIIQTSKQVHYKLINSSGVVGEDNVSDQITREFANLNGNYTLKITNLSNSTARVTITFQSEKDINSMGEKLLAGGGVCLLGIILIIAGTVIALRERRRR